MSQNFKVDLLHLQRVQRTLRKSANIFPNEKELLVTLEAEIIKVQDDNSLNLYYNMAQYLKQRLREIEEKLEIPQSGIEEAMKDLSWSIQYLQWLVKESKKDERERQ